MSRVAAIGLDAAEWTLVERLMDEGLLPNLSRLRDRRARCLLQNMVPYPAEAPWTQFVTGSSPSRTGSWMFFDPATYEISTTSANERPFYALGSGPYVIAFDVPDSAPTDARRGTGHRLGHS